MKIIVELNDNTLQHAVEAQVGKAVAAFTEAAIKSKVDEIVGKKVDRVGTAEIQAAIEKVVNAQFVYMLGANEYTRKQAIRSLLADAAEKILKGASK